MTLCPICNRLAEFYDLIESNSFDNSLLYEDIRLFKCKGCNHIFNKLYKEEQINLIKYYEKEYNIKGSKNQDMPGSMNKNSLKRYENLGYLIIPYFKEDSKILDIGCAKGGFLKYLETKGWFNAYGIDPIKSFVEDANNEKIKLGNVYDIPFPDNTFDIIILDQVLEHLINLKNAIKEIKRVLKRGGLCYIGVPEQEKLEKYYFLIKEHVQHFTYDTLKLLANKTGFEIVNSRCSITKMIGNIPLFNLGMVLKLREEPIYCYGIGREFMHLYPSTRLKDLVLTLVDDTPEKQKKTFKGMKIHSSEILKNASEDSFLIITAKVHKESLIKKVNELGFKGEIIDV